MNKLLRLTMAVAAALALCLAMSGCFKEKAGQIVENSGKSGMAQSIHGADVPADYDPDKTSVLEDVGALITGIFRGEKDFNSLLFYAISYGLYSLSFVIKGKKLTKEIGLRDAGLDTITQIIGEVMRSKDEAKAAAAKAIADKVRESTGSKATEVGSVVHKSVLRTREYIAKNAAAVA